MVPSAYRNHGGANCAPKLMNVLCYFPSAGRRRWRVCSATCLSASGELEVRYLRCRDSAHDLEAPQFIADPIKEPRSAPEQRRHKADLHLVDESRCHELLGGTCTSGECNVLAACGSARLVERRLDAIGNERKRRAPLEAERRAGMMCQ